ncbi:HAMP domain-containing protein [Bradyrhizobium tropiciagri]|uniref:HAMP domain-containing protein n=1 Tax=Bradyrhizobium tropiciagri TaxID=312253 RepID=UPI0024C04620|nr:HAMP domain-containing protein [Bradyrhizobium tropiciagri]
MLVALLITIAISISITRPLNSSASRMRRLADGHLDEEIKEMARTDEIGRMAATVHVFKRNTLEMRRLEQEEAKARAEAERSQTLLALASSLESKVKHVADELNGAPQVMEARARAMTDKSAKAGERVAHAAEAEKSSTTSVQTVASAAEELVSSINEIGQQASHSAGLTERAVGEANEAFSSRPTEVGLVGDRHTEVGPLARRKPGRAGARRVGLGEAKGQREPRSALVRTPSDTCVSYCA